MIRVAREDDRKEIPPLIMISQDGSVLYGSTEMCVGAKRFRIVGVEACFARGYRPAKFLEAVPGAAILNPMRRRSVKCLQRPSDRFVPRCGRVLSLRQTVRPGAVSGRKTALRLTSARPGSKSALKAFDRGVLSVTESSCSSAAAVSGVVGAGSVRAAIGPHVPTRSVE